MGEMKPTKGSAYNKREGYSTVYVFIPIGRGLVQEVAACGPTENGQEEQQANADLITEAFNVHHNTGLSPVQLVEQKKELLSALLTLDLRLRHCFDLAMDAREVYDSFYQDIVRAAVAGCDVLAKCEGVGNDR